MALQFMASRTDHFLTRGSIAASIVAVAATAVATGLIRMNASETVSAHSVPLPVSTVTYEQREHYRRKARLIGIVNAASDSGIGFEVAGTINDMPARVGTRVQQGELLAVLNTERRATALTAAEAELARIEAELELAKLRRQRLTELEAAGLAAKQTLDEARLGEQALLASQRATQARLLSAQLDMEKSSLRAPYAGVIASRLVQEGAVVSAGMPVFRLVAANGYEAQVGIPTQFSSQLIEGNLYTLELGETRFQAPLRATRADLDTTTLTVGAVFTLPETNNAVAGESIVLTLSEQVSERGGWLPLTALLEGDRGLWNILVVAEKDGVYVAEREAVEVVYSEHDRVYVRGTLANGAQVVATGLQRLSPGSAIAPVAAEQQ